VALAAAACLAVSAPGRGLAADAPPDEVLLVLEVYLNGQASPYLWTFHQRPDGKLAAEAKDLRAIGISPAALKGLADDAVVPLDSLPGLIYNYDLGRQSLRILANDKLVASTIVDFARRPTPIDPSKVVANTGIVLNYAVYGVAGPHASAVGGEYEARLLTRFGVLSSDGVVRYIPGQADAAQQVRLDTTFRYVDAARVTAVNVGDVVIGAPDWSPIYRLGGIQIQKDFANRPDIITQAIPALSASAAVPSTVDLYLNGMQFFSGQVRAGPFEFRSLPQLGGGGQATITLTDALGREQTIKQNYYFTPGLLQRGVLDYSLEAGYPRLNYGVASFDYVDSFALSGSFRYGLWDWLTLQGHAEGTGSLVNGGLGAVVAVGHFGALVGSATGSRVGSQAGLRYTAQFSGWWHGIDYFLGIERAQFNYSDVVTYTALKHNLGPLDSAPGQNIVGGAPILLAFSRETDRAGMSFALPFDPTSISLSYARVVLANSETKIAALGLSRTLFSRVSLWANGYKDFGTRKDYGVLVGLSLPLGRAGSASTSYAHGRTGSNLTTRLSRSPEDLQGSVGWSLTDEEPLSGGGEAFREATLTYQGRHGLLEAGVQQQGGAAAVTAYAEGGVVAMAGGVFFTPRVDDAFAVVQGAGAKTTVFADTRPVSITDRSGRGFVPSLRSYQENVVAIDPTNLPLDEKPERTEAAVIPAYHGGVVINFGVARFASAVVVLVDGTGAGLPLGAYVTLEGTDVAAVVGYDGRVYLTGLSAQNVIHVQRRGAPDCSVRFEYRPTPGAFTEIGPLTCR
jgi:outer membrane usher protein